MKLFLTLSFLIICNISFGQSWNNVDLTAHYLEKKSNHTTYINITSSKKKSVNFIYRRAFEHIKNPGYEFIKLKIENYETGYFYEILKNSSIVKKLHLNKGRYKITLIAKVGVYGGFGQQKFGNGKVNIQWIGFKD